MSAGAGEHTPEPWQSKHDFSRDGILAIIGNVDGEILHDGPSYTYTDVAEVCDGDEAIANAARIVACVNACAGIPTDQLSTLMGEVREAMIDVIAHLVAAHSLLSSGGKKAAPSDKMFDQMLRDYAKSIERGRSFLAKLPVQP